MRNGILFIFIDICTSEKENSKAFEMHHRKYLLHLKEILKLCLPIRNKDIAYKKSSF
jgi:hypothetical protein